MKKVEIFRNELRNYLDYKELLGNYRSMYETQNKLKSDDVYNERFEVLKKFNKSLIPLEKNLDETFTKLTGFKAIRYDIEPGTFNENLSEQMKLELVDKYNLQLIEFKDALDIAEKNLLLEIDRLKLNIEHIESIIHQLPNDIKNACIEVYCEKRTFMSKSKDLYYTDTGLFRRLERELDRLL